MLATNRQCRPDLPLPNNLQGKNRHKSFGTPTPSSPIKRYKESWGPTNRNLASWRRSEVATDPPDRHKTSHKGKTCIPWCFTASSTQWRRPPDGRTASMLSKRGFSRRPLMTSRGQESRHRVSTRSDPSKKPHPDTKKTGEKSTSTYHATTGCVALLSGSTAWTGS